MSPAELSPEPEPAVCLTKWDVLRLLRSTYQAGGEAVNLLHRIAYLRTLLPPNSIPDRILIQDALFGLDEDLADLVRADEYLRGSGYHQSEEDGFGVSRPRMSMVSSTIEWTAFFRLVVEKEEELSELKAARRREEERARLREGRVWLAPRVVSSSDGNYVEADDDRSDGRSNDEAETVASTPPREGQPTYKPAAAPLHLPAPARNSPISHTSSHSDPFAGPGASTLVGRTASAAAAPAPPAPTQAQPKRKRGRPPRNKQAQDTSFPHSHILRAPIQRPLLPLIDSSGSRAGPNPPPQPRSSLKPPPPSATPPHPHSQAHTWPAATSSDSDGDWGTANLASKRVSTGLGRPASRGEGQRGQAQLDLRDGHDRMQHARSFRKKKKKRGPKTLAASSQTVQGALGSGAPAPQRRGRPPSRPGLVTLPAADSEVEDELLLA